MTLRSEWELMQRQIEDERHDTSSHGVDTSMVLRNR